MPSKIIRLLLIFALATIVSPVVFEQATAANKAEENLKKKQQQNYDVKQNKSQENSNSSGGTKSGR